MSVPVSPSAGNMQVLSKARTHSMQVSDGQRTMFDMWVRGSFGEQLSVQKDLFNTTNNSGTSSTPTLSALLLRRNPEPVSRKVSFSPQLHKQSQEGAIAERGKVYNLSAEETEASDEVMAG